MKLSPRTPAALISVIAGSLAFAILTGSPRSAAAPEQDWSQVEIKTTHVSGSVWMLEGAGGNMAVSSGPDGMLLIDDEFAPLSPKIKAALAKIGEGPLRFVVNTHYHGDHVGGNINFGKDAVIIAHDSVRVRMEAGSNANGRITPPAPPDALPLVTFADSVTIHFNGEVIRVVHYPGGHTDGDAAVFFSESNVVHTGDLFFNMHFPFVDVAAGGDVTGYTNDVQRITGRLDHEAKVIPGHGPLGTVDDLRTYHRMLIETGKIVRRGVINYKPLDQIQEEGLPEEWKPYSWDFVDTNTWIEEIYRSVEKYQGLPTRKTNVH